MTGILQYILSLFGNWISIFLAPLRNPDMLWILIPIYIGWFAAEFFQEKKGTSLGNAISNGVIPLWASADWIRTLLRLSAMHEIQRNALFFAKIGLAVLIFAYGILIIVEGIKAKGVNRIAGRIRTVSYVMITFTPIFYNQVNVGFDTLLPIVIFFPLFYLAIEFIDNILPDPTALKADEQPIIQQTSIQQPAYQQYGQQAYPPRQQFPRQQL